MSESFEKAVEAASLAMLGRSTLSATTIRAALRAALPHLTAEDVTITWSSQDRNRFTQIIRKAKARAWDEGWHAGAGWPQDERNPYVEEANNDRPGRKDQQLRRES